jgi:hypothetical protein
MPYMLDGRRLRVGRPFKTADGVSYSQLWATQLSADQKTALGITYEVDPEPFDGKYYYSAGNPRQLDNGTDDDGNTTYGIRPDILQQQKDTAASLLSNTDWYVTRKSETDTAIPANVSTYRAAVRTVCGTREAEIAAVKTTEALEALMKAPDKITNDAGEVVDNPAAHLTPWPVLAE